jgi:hypothetical protein
MIFICRYLHRYQFIRTRLIIRANPLRKVLVLNLYPNQIRQVIYLFLVLLGQDPYGSGRLLSIKCPDRNVDVPAGTRIAVGGTSALANATHTNCNIAVQIIQHGFVQQAWILEKEEGLAP